jgi:hypothetical protein
MIAKKTLLPVGFLALLTGCAQVCAFPDKIVADPAPQCLYRLKINDINVSNYTVNGQVASDLIKKDKSIRTFDFRVYDLDKLQNAIQKGQEYYFLRKGNAPYLSLFATQTLEGAKKGSDAGADPEQFGK